MELTLPRIAWIKGGVLAAATLLYVVLASHSAFSVWFALAFVVTNAALLAARRHVPLIPITFALVNFVFLLVFHFSH